MVVNFSVSIYVIRYLGPEDFGLLSYSISFAFLFSFIATFGIDSIAVREILKTPDNTAKILGTSFALRLLGAVIVLCLVLISVLIVGEEPLTALMIFIISLSVLFQTFYILDFYFQAKVLIKYSTIVLFISVILSSMLKLVLVYLEMSLISFAIAQLMEIVFAALGYLFLTPGVIKKTGKWTFNYETTKFLLKSSWPLIVSGIMVAMYSRIDQILIKNMLDNYQTGIYAAAVKISEIHFFIPIALSAALFPAIISAKNTSEVLYQSRLQKFYDLMALLAVIFALPLTIFSDQIIFLLFGDRFAGAGNVMSIYVWATIFGFLGVASSQYLVAENLLKISMYRTSIGLFFNLLLNFYLIKIWGITGAAFATLISYAIATFSLFLFSSTRNQAFLLIKSILMLNIIRELYKKLRNLDAK